MMPAPQALLTNTVASGDVGYRKLAWPRLTALLHEDPLRVGRFGPYFS